MVLQSDHYGPPLVKVSKGEAQTQVRLSVSAENEKVCTIEKSPDLQTWSELHRYTNFNRVLQFDDFTATNSAGFYRVRTE